MQNTNLFAAHGALERHREVSDKSRHSNRTKLRNNTEFMERKLSEGFPTNRALRRTGGA